MKNKFITEWKQTKQKHQERKPLWNFNNIPLNNYIYLLSVWFLKLKAFHITLCWNCLLYIYLSLSASLLQTSSVIHWKNSHWFQLAYLQRNSCSYYYRCLNWIIVIFIMNLRTIPVTVNSLHCNNEILDLCLWIFIACTTRRISYCSWKKYQIGTAFPLGFSVSYRVFPYWTFP